MKERTSRRFAAGFTAAMAVITLTLIFYGWRHLHPDDEFAVSATAQRMADLWQVDVQPSETLYVYVLEEGEDGKIRALFPGPDSPANPLPPKDTSLRLPAVSSQGTLLLLAGARPLWSLDEAIYESNERGQNIPELKRDAVLSVRGLPATPASGSVSATLPPLSDDPQSRNALWARRSAP